jgi:hypothetical protein
MEVASMILNEAASYLDMVTEAVYEKAYPESWGAAVDRTETIHIDTTSNRQGVVNTLRVDGIELREAITRKIMSQSGFTRHSGY